MSTLREAAQQALEAHDSHDPLAVVMEILRDALAQEEPRRTGLPHCEHSCEANAFLIEIRRLKAELVAEREACAKAADLVAREIDDTNGTATYIAAAIRARSKT